MIRLRQAQISDAEFAAPLIQDTIGSIGLELTGMTTDAEAAQVIALFFRERGNRLSFTHTIIAEDASGIRPLGLALLYPGEWAQELDAPLREHLRMLGKPDTIITEGRAGELYVDTLAVIEQARGQGIGAKLLQEAQQRAKAQGLKLTLLAEERNPAIRLYTRAGLQQIAEETLAGHRYFRMSTGE